MDPRVTLITLGVSDVTRSRLFYEKLGFLADPTSDGNVAFFQVGPLVLALWGRAALAEDARADDDGGAFHGVALAQNLASKAEVDARLAHAGSSGARIVRPAHDTSWGGYSGYFADPDGHLWEVAWNPFWPLVDGQARLPPS